MPGVDVLPAGPAPDESVGRGAWRRSLAGMLPAGLLLCVLWGLMWMPGVFQDGQRGIGLIGGSLLAPVIATGVLLALLAWLEAKHGTSPAPMTQVVAAACVAALAALAIGSVALVISGAWDQRRNSLPVILWANFGQVLGVCASIALLLATRTRASRRHAALVAARRRHAAIVRRVEEARLQALQARVDPQLLFGVLDAVADRQAAGQPVDAILDALIAFLRSALPEAGRDGSTLGRECDVAVAWLALMQAWRAPRLAWRLEVADGRRHARFPPMVLVPLLDALLPDIAASAATVAVVAGHDDATLSIRIDPGRATPDDEAIAAVRARLADLYGDSARLTAGPDGVTLELPDADRRHR